MGFGVWVAQQRGMGFEKEWVVVWGLLLKWFDLIAFGLGMECSRAVRGERCIYLRGVVNEVYRDYRQY